jgi:hypothetical protein
VKKLSDKEQQFLLYLIKSCEIYGDLNEKESIGAINKTLCKDISRRTYYNYKKKLYDKEIITKLKDTMYDTKEMKCLLLECEETNKIGSLRADKLIADQFPNRKDLFHNQDNQIEEMEKTNKRIELINTKFEDSINSVLLNSQSIPDNATIREEFIKCGKDSCNNCLHGPYFYAYWKDKTKDNKSKLRKKYLGTSDPRR